jgi:hypothetical protein
MGIKLYNRLPLELRKSVGINDFKHVVVVVVVVVVEEDEMVGPFSTNGGEEECV